MEKIRLHNITKKYNQATANDHISLSIPSNKITVVVGDNGAGKSTLMKIMYGAIKPTSGSLYIDGRKVNLHNPRDAINYGIGMVSQHFSLIASLSVCENVFLGHEPTKWKFLFNYKSAKKKVNDLSKKYHFNLKADAKIQNLSVGEKQKVEIMKLLIRKADVLIFDEPTATLTEDEITNFFRIIETMIQQDKTIILVTHKLREMINYGDFFVIMEKGKVVGTFDRDMIDFPRLVKSTRLDIEKEEQQASCQVNTPNKILKVERINSVDSSGNEVLGNISFSVEHGCITVITGPEEAGQRELAEIIFNIKKPSNGDVFFEGYNISGLPIYKIRSMGVSFIPEDRMEFGIAKGCTVKENLLSPVWIRKSGGINNKKIGQYISEQVTHYDILCSSVDQKIEELSGGNIQKVIIARELSANPKLVIASHLTRGLDIVTTKKIYDIILQKSKEGITFLIFSSDLTEVKVLADNILIMVDGSIRMEVKNSEALTEENIKTLINSQI